MAMNEDRTAELSSSDSEERWRRFAWFCYPFMKLSFIPFGGEGMFRKKIIAFAAPEEGECVLDACCGTGMLTSLIAEKVGKTGKAVGIDISARALEKAAKRVKEGLPLTFRQASCAAIPLPDGSFDRVCISFGLHEMSEDDRLKSLVEVKRVLKDDGKFFILEYNLPRSLLKRFAAKAFNKLFESEAAYRMLIDGTLFQDLEQAGFSIKQRQLIGADVFQILHTIRASAGKNNA